MVLRRHRPFLLLLLFAATGIVVGLLHPSPADAFTSNLLPSCTGNGNCGFEDFVDLFTRAYGFGLSILGALSLFFFVYGGFLWLVSGGNQDRIAQGKRILSGTLLGVVIGLTSWLIVNVVIAFLVTPPGQTVDFTKVEINNRPWWNFLADSGVPTGCCIGYNGCGDDVTESRCVTQFRGQWKSGVDCTTLYECAQGCCVPTNPGSASCSDVSFGSCADGFTYVAGQACTNVPQCRGCCVKASPTGSICTSQQSSSECYKFYAGECNTTQDCPGDQLGCCITGNPATACDNDVRRHDCTGDFYPNELCVATSRGTECP